MKRSHEVVRCPFLAAGLGKNFRRRVVEFLVLDTLRGDHRIKLLLEAGGQPWRQARGVDATKEHLCLTLGPQPKRNILVSFPHEKEPRNIES